MQAALITLSSIITVSAVVPYVIEILRGTTKPRVVSWFTWGLLAAIASVASFSDGQAASGMLSGISAFGCFTVVVLGLRYGDRRFERLDIICQAAALAGIVLWQLFDSPALAVLTVIAIDLVGCIPTFKHSWQKPHEETRVTFTLSGIGGGLALAASGDWQVTAAAYPLYILLVNIVMTWAILGSPNRRVKIGPAELRDL